MTRAAISALIVVCLFTLRAPSVPAWQTALSSREEEMMRQVIELEAQARDAALHNDAAFTERTLAEDYVAIGPLGTVITKGESVAARRQAKLHYEFH